MAQRLLLSTCVWGSYVDLFLDYTLPSLISKGNILSKHKKVEISLLFLISKSDFKKFKENKNIKKISNVSYFLIDNFMDKKNTTKYNILNQSQKKVFQIVNQKDFDYLMLFYPDSIFPENYIKNCLNLIENSDVVLSPGPLISLEKYIEYLNVTKNPYNLSKIVKFTFNNLHPFYESFTNQRKDNPVNIFSFKDVKIFNCYDLHISILRKKLCKPEIDFDTVDGNYLSKIHLDKSRIQYANSPKELFIISYESIFSSRPDIHYDIPDYKTLSVYNIYGESFNNKIELKKNNFTKGYYILRPNITGYNYRLITYHLLEIKNLTNFKKLIFLNLRSPMQTFHSIVKYILMKLMKAYYKTPEEYRIPFYKVTTRSRILTEIKIRVIYYIYT